MGCLRRLQIVSLAVIFFSLSDVNYSYSWCSAKCSVASKQARYNNSPDFNYFASLSCVWETILILVIYTMIGYTECVN